MPDAAELRQQADRATALAAEAEAKAAREEERRALMQPRWRLADLLHTHLALTYPGAGSAFDGGDGWYYELPSGANADQRWIEEWTVPGEEHQRFLRMADRLTFAWSGYGPAAVLDPDDPAYETVETRLLVLIQVLGPRRTAQAVRERRERYNDHSLELASKEAIKAVEKLYETAQNIRVRGA